MKRGQRVHASRRRRLVRALVAALLLHVAFLLLPGTDTLPTRPLEVTILSPPRASVPTATSTRPIPEVRVRPKPTTMHPRAARRAHRTRRAGERRHARRAPARPRALRATEIAPAHTPARARIDVPLQTTTPAAEATRRASPKSGPAAPGVGPPAATRTQAIDLFPKSLFARLAGGPEPKRPLTEEARIQGRIQTTLREMQARDRVAVGLVDPYFRDLADHFDGAFDPDWSVLDKKAGRPGLAAALGAWLRDYRATARRYARTGSPYRSGEHDSTLLRGGPRFVPDTTVSGARPLSGLGGTAGLMDLWRDMVHGRAAGVELVAVLRVTQSRKGDLLDVRLETPSGHPTYDRLALRAVRDALRDPLPPPRAGVGLGLQGQRIESLWAFRTRFTVVPPLFALSTAPNMLGAGALSGCDLDSNGGFDRCFRPLQRNTFTRVELLAVY